MNPPGHRRLILAVLLIALPPSVVGAAERMRLDGPLIQGGLVRGTAAAGAAVRFDGSPVRVSPQGAFLIGFGRDARATQVRVTAVCFQRRRRLNLRHRVPKRVCLACCRV